MQKNVKRESGFSDLVLAIRKNNDYIVDEVSDSLVRCYFDKKDYDFKGLKKISYALRNKIIDKVKKFLNEKSVNLREADRYINLINQKINHINAIPRKHESDLSPRTTVIARIYSQDTKNPIFNKICNPSDEPNYRAIKNNNIKVLQSGDNLSVSFQNMLNLPRVKSQQNLTRIESDPSTVYGLYESFINKKPFKMPFNSFSQKDMQTFKKDNPLYKGANLDLKIDKEIRGADISKISLYPKEKEFLGMCNEINVEEFKYKDQKINEIKNKEEIIAKSQQYAKRPFDRAKVNEINSFLEDFTITGDISINKELSYKKEEVYNEIRQYYPNYSSESQKLNNTIKTNLNISKKQTPYPISKVDIKFNL